MAKLPNKNTNSISISQINTEVDDVSSNSLKTLSDAAKAGSDPKDGAPYGIGEFSEYEHSFGTTYTCSTQGGGGGAKGGGPPLYNYATPSERNWPMAGNESDWYVNTFSSQGGGTGMTISLYRAGFHYSGATTTWPTGWTSITSTGTNAWTVNRSAFSLSSTYVAGQNRTYVYFNITGGSYFASSGSGNYTLNV